MAQNRSLAKESAWRRWLSILAMSALVTCPGDLLGQSRFEFTFLGGFSTFFGPDPTATPFGVPDASQFLFGAAEDKPFLKSSYVVGLQGRVRVGARWGVEASAVWMPTEVCFQTCGGNVDLVISAYTLSGLYHLPRLAGRLEPFFALGGGATLYDARENVMAAAWSVGAGVTAPLGRGVEVRLEARNYMSLPNAAAFNPRASPNPSDRRFQSDLTLTVGFSFYKPRAQG